MNHDTFERPKGPSLLLLIACVTVAALLTFVAALGTSMLHKKAPERAGSSPAAPFAGGDADPRRPRL